MKGRILPLGEIAEYGKTDTVVLTLSINSTEAGILLDYVAQEDLDSSASKEPPYVVRLLTGYLETIRDRAGSQYRQDAVNTDGRSLPASPKHAEAVNAGWRVR